MFDKVPYPNVLVVCSSGERHHVAFQRETSEYAVAAGGGRSG